MFTGLRKGDSELIFSLQWGISSLPNVESVGESVFSLKRRAIIKRTDPLRIRDGLRVMKHTVYDVASNQLAFKVTRAKKNCLKIYYWKGSLPFCNDHRRGWDACIFAFACVCACVCYGLSLLRVM